MDSRALAEVFRSPDLPGLLVLDRLPVAIFVIDAAGKPYFANRQAERLLGRGINPQAGADQLAETYQAYVAGTNTPYPAERMPIVRALAGQECSADDMEVRHPDKTIQIEVWASPVLGETGAVEFAIAAFVDVTARKRAEAELRLARQLAAAIAAAPSFEQALQTSLRRICEVTGWALGQAWLPDRTGRQLTCSAAWYADAPGLKAFHDGSREIAFASGAGLPGQVWAARQSRWEPDVTRGRGFLRAALAADAGVVAGMAVPVLADDEVVAVIEFFVFERWERDERFLNLVSSVAAQLGVLVSQKQAEDALRTSEAEFRAVAETASDAIISASAGGVITYFNPAAEEMFGHPAQSAHGQPLTVLIPERFREAHRQGFERYLRTGEARILGPVDLFARRSDGSEFPAQLTLASWRTSAGAYFTAIVRDVSERVQAEQTVRHALALEQQATEQLRALDCMKNTLLQTVSHDLRNPIAAVLATTNLLAADADGRTALSPEVRATLVGNVAKTARRMERLLTDLIVTDRLHTVEPNRRPTDVGELVARVLAESDVDRQHPVYAEIQPVLACVDAAQVERIVENLLSNEAKHLEPGVAVWVRVAPADDGVLVSVEDAGPGVPAELRESIFEPFRRGPGAATGGLGIGLSLVARFASLHGGRAWVEDRSGGGAAFRVLLCDRVTGGE